MNNKNFEKKLAIEVAAVVLYNRFRETKPSLPKWEALPAWVKVAIKTIIIFRK